MFKCSLDHTERQEPPRVTKRCLHCLKTNGLIEVCMVAPREGSWGWVGLGGGGEKGSRSIHIGFWWIQKAVEPLALELTCTNAS